MVRAVVDVGSNSLLLVVAQLGPRGWTSLAETSRVTGLGRGTKSTGRLCPEGAAATLVALAEAFQTARAHGAEAILAGATMAVRLAVDRDEFLQAANAQGTPLHVVSGDQEAELGFLAVAEDPRFAGEERLSIVDPGGHSTELVTAERGQGGWSTLYRKSHAVGALGLREGPLAVDAPDAADILAATAEVDRAIGVEALPGQAGRVVTLGATGTNLVSIRDGFAEWRPDLVHGAEIDYEEVGRAVGWLSRLGDAGRRQVVGLEPGREQTIHAGALILERFLYALHVLSATVSVRGWRHALLDRPDFFGPEH